MSHVGLWCAIAGATVGVVTLATWNVGTESAAAPAAATAATTATLDGQQLFQMKGCTQCHIGPDSQPLINGFPPLDDAADWAGTRRPGMTADEYLAESMQTPSAFISPAFGGSVGATSEMPQLMLTPQEVDALVAYLLGG